MEEMTYVALKPLKVGGKRREPGELVPEAADWPRRSAWIEGGRLTAVARSSVNQEALAKAEAAIPKPEPAPEQLTLEERDETGSDTDSDVEQPDIEEFATGSGWYEIPGADKKLRYDEAVAYLASLEDGEEE